MPRTSAVERMDEHISELLVARGQPTVRIQAEVRGRQAELWQRALAATTGLGEGGGPLEADDLVGLLLENGVPILEAACRRQRERQGAAQPASAEETKD